MRKVIIIIVCLLIGFLVYTFIVALYKANYNNTQNVLPSKNINKQEKLEFEKTSIEKNNFDKNNINSDKTIVETNNITSSNEFDSSNDCGENCQSDIEKKKVEIYLIQNINRLAPKNSYSSVMLNVRNFTVDINANTGIVIYESGDYKYSKDFLYTQDNFGDITSMVLK